ncbi:MAG: VWA domain-containing protein [Deltaproteobacteria bacterium]|nr:VWA domain-containing protein [Deltaproteobacteria bacterium]
MVPLLLLAACGGQGSESSDDEVGDADNTDTATDSESESASESSSSDSSTDSETDATDTVDETETAESESAETETAETTADTESTETDIACEEFSSDVAPIPPHVLFLLDRSGSMVEKGFDPMNPDLTRWNVLYHAVEDVVDGGADMTIAFGAKTYSTQGMGECGVSPQPEVPIALNNAANLLGTIPGPDVLVNGGTPTNTALEVTIPYMQQYDSQGGQKFLILVTDGGLGCINDPNEALAEAVALLESAYMDDAITTFVVGISPSIFGPTQQLDAMAVAGGAPKMGMGGEDFYRADDAQQLADALQTVVEESLATSCLLNLEQAPVFPLLVKVVVNGMSYSLVDDCETEDGFVYTGPEMTQIEMCGQACEALGDVQMAEVEYYCDPG